MPTIPDNQKNSPVLYGNKGYPLLWEAEVVSFGELPQSGPTSYGVNREKNAHVRQPVGKIVLLTLVGMLHSFWNWIMDQRTEVSHIRM